MAEKSSYASSSSLERMRRLSKSDDRLNRFDSVQSASPQSVRPPHAQTCLPVTRVLEVLRLDNVLTSEQCTAAATHLESMPPETQGNWLRILLMNMVKYKQLTIDAAERYASQFALDTNAVKQQTETYNFPVYKWNKLTRNAQRRILQFDFQSKKMLVMHRGQVHKTFYFTEILRYEGDENERFYIYFANHHDYELDADSLEDKNKIFSVLNQIIQQNGVGDNDSDDETGDNFSSQVEIKQGQLEKRGHSAAYFTWAKRWVKVTPGSLSYYKTDNFHNALNSIQLGARFATVQKVDHNGFSVSTTTKDFHFRIPNPNNARPIASVAAERDLWIEAISTAASSLRFSSVFIGQESGVPESKNVSAMVRMLKRELKSLLQSLPDTEGSSHAVARVRKLHQMAKAIQQETSEVTPVASGGSTSPVKVFSPSLALDEPKDSLFKSVRSKFKRFGTPSKSSGGKPVSKISAPMLVTRPNDPAQPSVVSAKAAAVPSPILVLSSAKDSKKPVGIPSSQSESFIVQSSQPKEHPKLVMSKSGPAPHVPAPYVSKSKLASVVATSEVVHTENQSSEPVYDLLIPKATEMKPESDKFVGEYAEVGAEAQLHTTKSQLESSKMSEFQSNEYSVVQASSRNSDEKSPSARPVVYETVELPTSASGQDDVSSAVPVGVYEIIQPFEDSKSPPSVQHLAAPVVPPSSQVAAVPPPPPPLAGGFPPGVPPPPPGLGGLFGGLFPSLLPPKPTITPNCKLKQFFWAKVPDMMVSKAFWLEANDVTDKLNVTDLEHMFAADEASPLPTAPKPVAPKSLLDSKRAQNLGIFLSGFKMSVEELDGKLNVVDPDKGLPLEHVISLKRFQPSEEDVEMYRNFSGDKSVLHSVDQFMMKLCSVADLSRRLELMLTIREFPEQFEELLPSISTAIAACNELTENRNFTVVLEYVLAIGNYLNGGTARGGAYGFQLKSLPKLADTRGRRSAKYTLLHYLVDLLKQRDPLALNVVDEMTNIPKAVNASVKALVAEVDVMKRDLSRISRNADNLLKKKEHPSHTDKTFNSSVKAFVLRYEKETDVMDRQCSQLKSQYLSVLERYGEQQNTNSEDIFSSVHTFLDLLKKAKKDQGSGTASGSGKFVPQNAPTGASALSSFSLLAQIAASDKGGKVLAKPKKETQSNGRVTNPAMTAAPLVSPTISVSTSGSLHSQQSLSPRFTSPVSDSTSDTELVNGRHLSGSQSGCSSDVAVEAVYDTPKSFCSLDNPVSTFKPDLTESIGSGVTVTSAEASIQKSTATVASYAPNASPPRRSTDNATNHTQLQYQSSPRLSRSLSVPTRQSFQPTKEGYLQKMSGGKKRAPHWDTRFFELSDTGYLHYYKKQDGKCMGSIYLRGCPLSISEIDSRVLVLESEGRVWQLKADTPELSREWLHLLEFYTKS